VKKSDLKELIREEIKKVLSENTEDVKGKLPKEPGKYKIEYITADDEDGGPDSEGKGEVNISQNALPKSTDNISPSKFWEGEARSISNFKINKVTKVTKIS
jgi:hypothetical protein